MHYYSLLAKRRYFLLSSEFLFSSSCCVPNQKVANALGKPNFFSALTILTFNAVFLYTFTRRPSSLRSPFCNLGDNGNQMASDKNAHHLHSWLELICQALARESWAEKKGTQSVRNGSLKQSIIEFQFHNMRFLSPSFSHFLVL